MTLSPSPVLSYNIGLSYDRLGNSASAITYYQQYLQGVPNAPNRAEVEQSIARLQAASTPAKPVVAPPEPAPPVTPPPVEEPPTADPAPAPPEAERRPAVRPPEPPAPPVATGEYRGTDPELRRVSGIDIASIRDRYTREGYRAPAGYGGSGPRSAPPPPPAGY